MSKLNTTVDPTQHWQSVSGIPFCSATGNHPKDDALKIAAAKLYGEERLGAQAYVSTMR